MQSVSEGLVDELASGSLHLNTAVKSVNKTSDEFYEVHSTGGVVFKAKHVIVSTPTSLYHTIEFYPPLPEKKQRLAKSTKLGYYSKVVLVFDQLWWHVANLSGVMTSRKGPISFTRDNNVPDDDQWSISCFIVGDIGRTWNKKTQTERRSMMLEQFHSTFSTVAVVPEPIAIHEKTWSEEPYFLGAPSPIMGPGVLTTLGSDILQEPVGNLHFVGTETSVIWKGYMDGAVRSGQRGAAEVISALRCAV